MYKFSFRTAIGAILILISSISIFSQQHYDPSVPQVVEGCSARVTNYPETPPYYIYDDPNIPILRQVDRVETGFSRFTFTFRPDQVSVTRKKLLKFTLYPYGRELGNVNDLSVVRHSGVPSERGAILNWNQSGFASVKASGTWYAVFNSAVEYLQPLELGDPGAGEKVNAMRNPGTHFSYDGKPRNPGSVDPIPGQVWKLTPGMELDTSGIEPGIYWVTLQGEADFGNQKCQKTTPPVMIEIKKPYLNVTLEPRTIGPVSFKNASTHTITANISGAIGTVYLDWSRSSDDVDVSACPISTESNVAVCQVTTRPGRMVEGRNIKVRVDARDGDRKDDCEPYCTDIKVNRLPKIEVTVASEDCKTVTATAKISDDDIPAQPLSLEWEVKDQNGNPINVSPGGSGGSVVILEKKDLKLGTYTFKGTVFDTLDYNYDDASTRYICEGGLGLVYFQFEVPDRKKPGKVINPKKPEGWAGGDSNVPDTSPYPSAQFPLFYSTTGAQEPTDRDMNNNNTKWMEEVVDMLHDKPAYLLKIFGYADFEGKPPYDNEALGMRRAIAVRDYLVFRYREKYKDEYPDEAKNISKRIVRQAVVETRGARFAQSCDPYKWTDPRRWDRRAEMFLTKDRYADAPDYPRVDPCSRQPAGYRKPAKPKKRR